MAAIRNGYEETLDTVTSVNFTLITGENVSTSVNISPEISTHFIRAVYQTLLDAGYNDAVLDLNEYSITVLNFKFFVVCSMTYSGCGYNPRVYIPNTTNTISIVPNNSTYSSTSLTSIHKGLRITNLSNTLLNYHVVVRGNKDSLMIQYGYNDFNRQLSLIFIAKAKNLITSEIQIFTSREIRDKTAYASSTAISKTTGEGYIYKQNNDKTWTQLISSIFFDSFYTGKGINTNQSFVVLPQFVYYGTYLIYGMIQCNETMFISGNYYKIGGILYYCNKYGASSNSSETGYDITDDYFLLKVSN